MVDTSRSGGTHSFVLRELCRFALYFAVAAAAFSGYYQKWHFAEADMPGDHSRAYPEDIFDGTAYRPYIYRQLLPDLASFADRLASPALKQRLYELETDHDDPLIYAISGSPTVLNQRYTFRYLALYLFTFLGALAAVYSMFLLCRELEIGAAGANFAPVVMMLLLPYVMSEGGYYYDFPELALMALSSFVILRFRWWWVIPIVALGEWNKESFLFFVFTLYPVLRSRNSRAKSWSAMGAMCLVCGAIYLRFRAEFAHNPGGTMEVWWLEQLRSLIHPAHFLYAWEETYGIPAPKIYTLFPIALLLWACWQGWRYLPLLLRRHAKTAMAVNLPLYFILAFPGELRDLSILYVSFLVIVACLIDAWSGVRTARGKRWAAAQEQ